ncbi:MAG: nitrilase-related carbon-nitrogen hydrolase [Anaerolineae bacterium]
MPGVRKSTWPPPGRGDLWITTLRHIAKEGGAFVIGCCMPLHLDDIPDQYEFKRFYSEKTEWINSGQSCIIGPDGNIITGPIEGKEEILYAEIDLKQITAAKRMFDVAGHYSRPDVLKFSVNQKPNPVLQ